MRQWRDCKTTRERKDALADALKLAGGNVTNAAKVLGLNRQYLHRVIASFAKDSDSVATSGSGDTHVSRESVATGARVAAVAQPPAESLTYGGHVRKFPNVATAPTIPAQEAIVRTAVDLPRSWLIWLEQEALRRKQRGEMRWLSKSPVVVEALEMLRARLESQPKPKAAAREKSK